MSCQVQTAPDASVVLLVLDSGRASRDWTFDRARRIVVASAGTARSRIEISSQPPPTIAGGEEDANGSRDIEFCGIDVELTEQSPALGLLREDLLELGAPDGTELHYTRGRQRLKDELVDGSWSCERPREMRHPGFGR